ncbi:hypothetical protein NITLEN_10146 [Nitrospira lenta]|uniref:Uncharacterized protein n=1 Tax=Nitrospira lenta TaxID=1436998 RepID=A0A330L004_9BACT|nr:hypothetical protein NITLEN_10146 [Nitrospira lenta]
MTWNAMIRAGLVSVGRHLTITCCVGMLGLMRYVVRTLPQSDLGDLLTHARLAQAAPVALTSWFVYLLHSTEHAEPAC